MSCLDRVVRGKRVDLDAAMPSKPKAEIRRTEKDLKDEFDKVYY